MADDSTDDKRKTLLFLHGMESRYGVCAGRTLGPNENPRAVAGWRAKVSRRPDRPFNRPLLYPAMCGFDTAPG
jgi:hypothetical protein